MFSETILLCEESEPFLLDSPTGLLLGIAPGAGDKRLGSCD
jgi:hypothetical protein